jgi:hypothetical protein
MPNNNEKALAGTRASHNLLGAIQVHCGVCPTEPQTAETKPENATRIAPKDSLYRTKWLMAHNSLHRIVHESGSIPSEVWNDYLNQLESAEEVAS